MNNTNWSNEEVMQFLEHYQAEPCIWDPRNKDHKDKKKVADAWSRLSEVLKKPVKEIKNKKEILMVIFRKHLKKKQDSIRSGSGVEDVYEPVWFAYQFMESFLLPIYTSKIGLNTEMQSRSSEAADGETVDEAEETENNSLAGSSTPVSTVSSPSTSKSKEKSRRRTASNIAEQQMATAFGQLTNILSQRQSCANAEEDECDLYAKLLAKKMRELPKDDRKLMMYEIDGLFIKRIKQRSFSCETPSPQYSFQYARPSSVSSEYVVVPNRPARIQSLSEPSTSHHDPFPTNPISFERSSSPLQPSHTRNRNENITIYSTKCNPSKSASTITVVPVSEEVIVPPRQRQNIINEAFQRAQEDFEQYDTDE